MELAGHLEALQNDLAAVARDADEPTSAAAERLTVALRASLNLRLLEVLSEAALELSGQLPSGHVEVRLAGQDPSLLYVEEVETHTAPSPEDGMAARITLRLPEALKGSLEGAAAREGVSVNTWIVRALARAVSGGPPTRPGPGRRMTGFARS